VEVEVVPVITSAVIDERIKDGYLFVRGGGVDRFAYRHAVARAVSTSRLIYLR
jgi:hypothetical protein